MKNPVFDKDLTLLFRKSENEDLEPIAQLILSAPSQTLTVQKAYRAHPGDHNSYADELVYEVTSFGGNSLANLVRGHGIAYADMVRDVAKALGLKPNLNDTTPTLEEKIILKIVTVAYDRLELEDRVALSELANIGVQNADGVEEKDFAADEIGARIASTME